MLSLSCRGLKGSFLDIIKRSLQSHFMQGSARLKGSRERVLYHPEKCYSEVVASLLERERMLSLIVLSKFKREFIGHHKKVAVVTLRARVGATKGFAKTRTVPPRKILFCILILTVSSDPNFEWTLHVRAKTVDCHDGEKHVCCLRSHFLTHKGFWSHTRGAL